MGKENVVDKSIGEFSQRNELIQAILLGGLAFLVPTFLAQLIIAIFGETSVIAANSQLIVGSVVNILLIMSAININGWRKIIGIITMPSISTILSGYVFGTASIFMMYMIPAIWLGNFVLVYIFKMFLLKKNINYFFTGAIGVIAKVLIIFGFFELLSILGIFPDKIIATLQTAMGLTQLITATIAVCITYAFYALQKKSVCKFKKYN